MQHVIVFDLHTLSVGRGSPVPPHLRHPAHDGYHHGNQYYDKTHRASSAGHDDDHTVICCSGPGVYGYKDIQRRTPHCLVSGGESDCEIGGAVYIAISDQSLVLHTHHRLDADRKKDHGHFVSYIVHTIYKMGWGGYNRTKDKNSLPTDVEWKGKGRGKEEVRKG